MQCTKSGRQASCEYASGPPRTPTGAVLLEEERKRKKFKPSLAPATTNVPEEVESPNVWMIPSTEQFKAKISTPKTSLGRVFVKGDRSRYLGLGDRMSMLDYFEDARSFILSGFHAPDMTDMLAELSVIQKNFQDRKLHQRVQTPPSCPSLGRPGLVAGMLNSFPSELLCGVTTDMYSIPWEGLIRIVHRGTLEKSRADLFSERSKGVFSLPPSVKESAVPQLLAIMALSARLSNRSVPEADRVSEEQISGWIDWTQRWVDDLKGKERLTLPALKAQVLLLLSNQNNLMPPADLWQKSGNLMRNAMVMGLHHDPEDCLGFSPFEKEQRRKVWRSIVELDIQLSLATGMSAAIRTSDFNARDLLNVDDSDLTEDMTDYPPEKPQHQWTDSIAQIALGTSLKERLDAANILGGSIDLDQDAPAILIRAGALERYLHLLPEPLRSDTISGRNSDKSSGKLFTKIMLDVFIRRPSLALYKTVALSPLSNRYPAARKAAVQSSIALLSHLDALDPTVADLNAIKDRDLLSHFHVLCKNDIIQASIMLCFEIRRLSLASGIASPDGLQEEVPWTKHSLTRIVENTLNSLIQRLGEFGSDLKDILPLSIVLQCARSDGTPEERRELMRNGAERILNACRSAISELPAITPPVPGITNNQDPNQPHAPSAPPLPFYWYAGANPNMAPAYKRGSNVGPPHGFGDRNMVGVDIDFQDFDFGFADWGMDQAWA